MTVTQYSLSDVLPFNHLDDSSFSLALYELQNGPVHFDPDRFSSLRYNPIFSNSNASLTQSGSLDPDINFNAVETPCDYFIENQFNEMLRRENYSDADFSFLHLNIRSLPHNLVKLTDYLSCLNIKFSVIGISETWLNDSFHSVDISGFKFFFLFQIFLSIAYGVVLDQMKIARMVPLFKADDQSLFTNYRPTSVLPSFSKFLERIIYNRLYDYLTNLHILCDNQFGFRKNHSTTLALIDLHEKISSAIDRGELAVGVFLDLSKAFDTVNHSILFDKLEHYGIRGLALKWIKSYFSNRLQFVEYNGYVSSCANIMCGVPQGSILGPLFFLLYINDIINTSTILQLILFADDTNVFVSHKDKDCLTNILNAELNKLSLWFRANRLSLNLKKTKFIVFKPCQKRTNQTI